MPHSAHTRAQNIRDDAFCDTVYIELAITQEPEDDITALMDRQTDSVTAWRYLKHYPPTLPLDTPEPIH